jgi:hypothetical protein
MSAGSIQGKFIIALALALGACDVGAAIQQSHIEGNVPAEAEFDAMLQRDLATYFSASASAGVSVSYEMLRKDPTQSGAAFPKYYVWVTVRSRDGAQRKGAVRLAAVDKKQFNVTDFLPAEDIRTTPDRAGEIFPAALVPRIKELATAP